MGETASEVDVLVEQTRRGDQLALAQLFELNRERLMRMVSIRLDRRLKGRVDEADVLQEAFLNLSKRTSSFGEHPEMSAYVWMRLAVKDLLITLHRKHIKAEKRDARREVSIHQKANPDESSADIVATLAESFSSVGGKVAKAEVTELIQATLESMEPMDRDIILMRTFEGMSNQEAAEALGLSQNGASSRFSRAISRLQKEFMQAQGSNEI